MNSGQNFGRLALAARLLARAPSPNVLENNSFGEERMRATNMILAAAFFAMTASLAGTAAVAQGWPQRPVKVIVTLGAGSGTDIAGRLLATSLQEKWGQPVTIENRPGGGGLVAINAFISAKDDHILLLSGASVFIAHPYVHDKALYRREDLIPVARVSNPVVGIFVPSALPVNSIRELVAFAKQKPGELNWVGVTPGFDFTLNAWLKHEGIDIKKVPYRNPVEAANDLAENRVQLYGSAVAILQAHQQAGKVKMLAVTNSSRWSSASDIPTVDEAGAPLLTLDPLVGLFGTPSITAADRDKIASDVKAVLTNNPTIQQRIAATAQVPNPGGPAEFAADMARQRETIAAAARAVGETAKW